MLTFKTTNILLIGLLLVAAITDWLMGIPFFVYPLLLLIYVVVVVWGCCTITGNFFLPVVCSADTGKREIAISFDDGPAANYTGETLDVLDSLGVKAAFFCIGNRIAAQEQLLRQLYDKGHLVGNHSYSHAPLFDLFSAGKMLNELQATDKEFERVLGIRPKLFRPPYGVINPNLKNAIEKGGYTPVGWSVRSLDTVIKDEALLLKKICKPLKPGAVYLFHDTSKTTLAVLPAFIQWVKDNGYSIVRLDHLLQLKAYV